MSWSVEYQDDQQNVHLDPIVKSVSWSGDIKQAARKLVVELSNTGDQREIYMTYKKGGELRLIWDEKLELFRGVLFADQLNSKGQMTLTAYDENIYLTKSKDTKIFRNMTASSVIKKLCGEFSISTGEIQDTGYVIPKLVFRDKTLFEMMVMSLTESQKQNGEWYHLTSREGKLQLLARKEQPVKWVLENGVNVLDASYSQSIEDTKTQIKVAGGDAAKKEISAAAKDGELIRRFGVMQHLEKPEQSMTKSQMEQRAKQLLADLGTIEDQARIDCLGIPEVISGSCVYVKESVTGILGGYYVSADDHRFERGNHTMSLTLSATDDIPRMEYKEAKGG
ncbi:XkdQ/YqbQ family protein [Paenibacillus cellulositrophicus]|uniref:XkdQ/YqbQ family protein n=1 Tax=Paenibacillus cellulositrophicus TaxID=562959 RepID=UPI003D98E596